MRLLADAHVAAELFTDDLIAADKQLDVIGGSAGAILGLLRLYRDSRSADVLDRAVKCGEHLLAQSRLGPEGRRSWVGQGFGPQPLNGMSHGAAGFAYALASLAAATRARGVRARRSGMHRLRKFKLRRGAQELAGSARRRRTGLAVPVVSRRARHRPCAPRHGQTRQRSMPRCLAADVAQRGRRASSAAGRGLVDTLCCGTLGSIEFFCEAGDALGRGDLARACIAAADGRPAERRRRAAITAGTAAKAVQSRSVSRPCRRRLHVAAPGRSHAAQCADLGIAGYGQVAVTSALNISKACTRT